MWAPRLLRGVYSGTISSVGVAPAGLSFHKHDESWLGLAAGEKAWFIVPHGASTLPRSRYSRVTDEAVLAAEPGALSCVQRRGEVIYAPGQTWHATINRAPTDPADGSPLPRPRGVGPLAHTWAVGFGGIALSSVVQAAVKDGNTTLLRELLRGDPLLMVRGATTAELEAAHYNGTIRPSMESMHPKVPVHFEELPPLATLKWLVRNGPSGGRNTMTIAARDCGLRAVQWMLTQGTNAHDTCPQRS